MPEDKIMVSYLEDRALIKQIDLHAKREGTDRSAILRRALRRELSFLSSIPTSGKLPTDDNKISTQE